MKSLISYYSIQRFERTAHLSLQIWSFINVVETIDDTPCRRTSIFIRMPFESHELPPSPLSPQKGERSAATIHIAAIPVNRPGDVSFSICRSTSTNFAAYFAERTNETCYQLHMTNTLTLNLKAISYRKFLPLKIIRYSKFIECNNQIEKSVRNSNEVRAHFQWLTVDSCRFWHIRSECEIVYRRRVEKQRHTHTRHKCQTILQVIRMDMRCIERERRRKNYMEWNWEFGELL